METLAEKLIRQALWLSRYKDETSTIIIDRLNEVSKKLESDIKNIDLSKKSNFNKLNKLIQKYIIYVYADFDKLLEKDSKILAELSYDSTQKLINSVLLANELKPKPYFKDLKNRVKEKLLDINRPLLGSTI